MILKAAEPSSEKATVLVVDDEVLIRMVIADYLRDAGYQVIEAGSADEALEYLRTPNQVRVVFSDVRMPGAIDGVELAQRVRVLHPHIGVLLASGHLPSNEAIDTTLFSKPYDMAAVESRIRAMLGETDNDGTA